MRSCALLLVAVVLVAALLSINVEAQGLPYVVYGYVYMPDGSPASGAQVTVTSSESSGSATTGSDGKYTVTLSLSPGKTYTVTVRASKDSYTASKSFTADPNEGGKRVDLTLAQQAPQPSPTPTKKSTGLSLSSMKTVYVEEEAVLTGSISPAMSVNIVLYIRRPDGATDQVNVRTDSGGKFSYSFTPSIPGRYEAYALYLGSNEYSSSKSNTVSFSFKKMPKVSLSASAYREQVVLKGSVSPAPKTATVTVYISLDGGKTWLPFCNTTTNSDGSFTVNVSISISGELMFKAVLPETETLSRAESAASGVKLVSTEEEMLRSELERINEENQLLKANISNLVVRLKETEDSLRETGAKLSETTSVLEKVNETAQLYRSEANLYKTEASLYKTIAAVGIPALFVAGIAVGVTLGPKIRKKG